MSHFAVLVIGENPEDRLAPFQENENGGKWDWYQLGGRWSGLLKLKEGHEGVKAVSSFGVRPSEEGYTDSCLKQAVDVDGMRADCVGRALKRWNDFQAILNGRPLPPSWAETLKKYPDDIESAQTEYRQNPVVADIDKADLLGIRENLHESFDCTQKEFLKRAKNRAICTFAVISDGNWYERGKMGWWGCVSDEKEEKDWNEEYLKLFDSIPDDVLVSIYDCHI